MSSALLAVVAQGGRSWTHVLLGAVRPEFRAEVYVPDDDDPVLTPPSRADSALVLRPVERCGVPVCRRSVHARGLCTPHYMAWRKHGRAELEAFVQDAEPSRAARAGCLVAGCAFPAVPRSRLCDTHRARSRHLRTGSTELGPEAYAARLTRARRDRAPRFDSRGLEWTLQLELQFALQCRHDARGGRLTPRVYHAVMAWARDAGMTSLLDRSDRSWACSSREELRPQVRKAALAFLRYARHQLQSLREQERGGELWEWDVWPVEQVDPDGRWAHQPTRRIYFSDIHPAWLLALVKRWARWRLSAATKSPLSIAHTTSSIRHLCRWLEHADTVPQRPGELTRELLERFHAHLRACPDTGETRKRTIIVDLKVFLDDVRMHGWEPELPASAVYHRAELPRVLRVLPRYIDEFVMAQIEAEENLARLPDQTSRTLVRMLIETGLRSVDAMRLPLDPVTTDQTGAPYLRFRNHKLSREAVIPISQRLLAEIHAQQRDVRARFPNGPWLFPRPWQNTGGQHPLGLSTLNRRLRLWLQACEIRDRHGRLVRVTSHQFRHTLATRLVNNEVSLETVRRLLDHGSPEMTARYAQIHDQTLRREWERYQQRITICGELIPLDPDGPLSDAAWAKENLARAKQTLPNGYCGLPLQQTCPHPNACLTCDSFLTTIEFLPLHREQLARTDELIAQATADGRQRLIDMNTPVRANLLRIIDGLEALDETSDDAA